MPDSSGADSLTYTSTSGELITNSFASDNNYYGTIPVPTTGYSIYTISNSITSFTNTYSLLGGGGGSGSNFDGGHGLLINASYTVTTVTNLGALLGGGGGGTGDNAGYGGAGGGGGGGVGSFCSGGSIVKSITAGSGTIDGAGGNSNGTGGGGPSGNGGSYPAGSSGGIPYSDSSGGLGGVHLIHLMVVQEVLIR